MKNLFGKLSLIAASLVLPATIFIGLLANWWYKANNPDNVNIAHGLAYIKPLMTIAIVVFVTIVLVGVVTAIIGLKKDEDKSLAKVGLILVGSVVLLSVGSALINGRIDKLEEDYTKEQAEKFLLPTFPFGQKKSK